MPDCLSYIPCNVSVMDCSSFSNSSVRVRGRCAIEDGRDMVTQAKWGQTRTDWQGRRRRHGERRGGENNGMPKADAM